MVRANPRLCCRLFFYFRSGAVEFDMSSPTVRRQEWGVRPRLVVDVVLALSFPGLMSGSSCPFVGAMGLVTDVDSAVVQTSSGQCARWRNRR